MLKILLESTSSLGGVGVHLGREKLPDVGFVGALERAGGGETVGMETKGSFSVRRTHGGDRRRRRFNAERGENLYQTFALEGGE